MVRWEPFFRVLSIIKKVSHRDRPSKVLSTARLMPGVASLKRESLGKSEMREGTLAGTFSPQESLQSRSPLKGTFNSCWVDDQPVVRLWLIGWRQPTSDWPLQCNHLSQSNPFQIIITENRSKHRKNCECCPVSLLIVRSQRLWWHSHWVSQSPW